MSRGAASDAWSVRVAAISVGYTMTRLVVGMAAVVFAVAAAPLAQTQVVYPKLPDTVDVQIRYRIRADREERYRQFRVLEKHLAGLGFQKTRKPNDELDILDPTAERFEGTVPSKNVLALLNDPRVQTILFKPTDFQYPADSTARVSLRIRIAVGLQPAEQQKFHGQVVEQLGKMGFREATEYFTSGFTLVRGDLPVGNLFRLMKDLRTQPGGWFLPDTLPRDLPSPLKNTLPIRAIEVLANADLTFFTPQAVPANRLFATPDLRTVLDDPAAQTRPIRIEAVMDRRIDQAEADRIRARLRSAFVRQIVNPVSKKVEPAFATLEGAVGNVATLHFPQAADVERYASEEGVVTLRLPRAAEETAFPLPAGAAAAPPADVLAASRVAAFHELGYRGRRTRIVVIASEFPDLGSAMGLPFLDASLRTPVQVIDLTAETSPDLLPAPAGKPTRAGIAAARAAHLAAPEAAIVLVRVDPASLHQVLDIANFVRGGPGRGFTQALQSRAVELEHRKDDLRRKNDAAVYEYRRAFQDPSEEEGPRLRRERARKAFDQQLQDEAELARAIARMDRLREALTGLAGAEVVVNTLEWESGFAVDGLSELAQTIDRRFASEARPGAMNRSATRPRPPLKPVWVQAASPSLGAVWGGPYLDRENNRRMEFAPPEQAMPAGGWTRELNFLGRQSPDGKQSSSLAAGSKVRLTIQWREAHDPSGYGGEDSIFPLRLRVFQQLDPEGKTRASDELAEIARTNTNPYRLYAEPTYGVYEQILEFAVPADGRYCLMIEGGTTFDPRLPALERHIEVEPRMFIEYVGAGPDRERPIFASFATRNGGVGIPGDAKAAITVGPSRGGLTGGGPGVELLVKPDLLADGAIDVGLKTHGPAVAAGFAGGVLADLIGSGAMPSEIIVGTGLRRGGPARVPENWLKIFSGRP